MHGLEHLVHTAMTLPEDELRALDRLTCIAPVGLIGVPDDHGFSRQPHLVGRIAAQVLIREKEDLLPPGPGPFNHRLRVGGRTGNPAMFAAKRFKHGGRVHIDRGHHGIFHRKDSPQRFPALINLFDGRHVCHGAAGGHVRKDHRLLRAAENIGGFGHEVHAAKDDVGPLRPLSCQLREQKGIPAKVRMLDDFIPLIIMTKDHDSITEHAFRLSRPAEQFFRRQSLVVRNRFWKCRECLHYRYPMGKWRMGLFYVRDSPQSMN